MKNGQQKGKKWANSDRITVIFGPETRQKCNEKKQNFNDSQKFQKLTKRTYSLPDQASGTILYLKAVVKLIEYITVLNLNRKIRITTMIITKNALISIFFS